MHAKALAAALSLWTSACVGCALFLLADLLPTGPSSFALLGQLAWLALIGSIPTTLLLGSASAAAGANRAVAMASAVAVVVFSAAVGWEHTDFLLSGPRWAVHPQRAFFRASLDLLAALIAGAGWLWLIVGMRIESRRRLVGWVIFTAAAVALLADAIVRFRAYDYSMAQLVFPAGVFSGAIVYLLGRARPQSVALLVVALVILLCGLGTRLSAWWVSTGEREVIAYSRAGALATLYVLPRFVRESTWSSKGEACPPQRPSVEQRPIEIEPDRRRNVIIVTVDALRNDVIGAEAGGRVVTPELSRLSRDAVAFDNATTTYPATLFAVGSAFTGLSPAELYLSPRLPDTIFTLSRARLDRQIAVLPDVSWFRLPIVARFLAPNLDRVFAPSDAAATAALISRLQAARHDDASVMAWIHYYSPHDPYRARRAFPFGEGKKNAYLGEVASFDRELGHLLDYLKEARWLEDTLVIFFSDHGEALGEKAYWGHHVYLNGWMIDVPLVLWHPDLSPARPSVGVSLADVAPTVLHFLGLPFRADIAAQSLFTLDYDLANRPTFSEAFPVRGRELFDRFLLPALDDATIDARIRSIRTASKGYEPKGSVTLDRYRLIHHRSADAKLVYDRQGKSGEELVEGAAGAQVGELLEHELEQWNEAQLRRIRCRLRVSVEDSAEPRLE